MMDDKRYADGENEELRVIEQSHTITALRAQVEALKDKHVEYLQIAIQDQKEILALRAQLEAWMDQRYAESLEAEVATLRAERDTIAAVTVAACAEWLRNDGFQSLPQRMQRALSPLDPVKAAAGVLLAHTEADRDDEIGPWLSATAGKATPWP